MAQLCLCVFVCFWRNSDLHTFFVCKSSVPCLWNLQNKQSIPKRQSQHNHNHNKDRRGQPPLLGSTKRPLLNNGGQRHQETVGFHDQRFFTPHPSFYPWILHSVPEKGHQKTPRSGERGGEERETCCSFRRIASFSKICVCLHCEGLL